MELGEAVARIRSIADIGDRMLGWTHLDGHFLSVTLNGNGDLIAGCQEERCVNNVFGGGDVHSPNLRHDISFFQSGLGGGRSRSKLSDPNSQTFTGILILHICADPSIPWFAKPNVVHSKLLGRL